MSLNVFHHGAYYTIQTSANIVSNVARWSENLKVDTKKVLGGIIESVGATYVGKR